MIKNKMQFTAIPPLGVAIEVLKGPLEGSKAFTYFMPKEGTTGVTVLEISNQQCCLMTS
jgi:hypothetical protein